MTGYLARRVDFAGSARSLSSFLESAQIPFEQLKQLNWEKEFPYCPHAEFRICHNSTSMLLNYRVEEDTVKAVTEDDNGPVWCDSCMECFLQPAGSDAYYNFESNCIASILVGWRTDRDHKKHIDPDKLKVVDRFSTLDRSKIEKTGPQKWEMSLIIPTSVFFGHDFKTLDGVEMKGNVYKCGDHMATPHFVSYYPILTPSPDFHRPEFFQSIKFE